MGKAAKRERQKTNRALREEVTSKAQSREKTIRAAKGITLVLIVPLIIAVSIFVNKATDADVYTAKITVAINGVTELPNDGVIEIELAQAQAPKSVKHFMAYASNQKYDGLSWHRVVSDFVIQGGDPSGDGTGNLGSSIVAELPERGYKRGDLAWAKGGSDPAGTAGSQFFVVTGENKGDGVAALNQKTPPSDGSSTTATYQYGIIGRVTKGLAAALEIEKLAPAAAEGSTTRDGAPTKRAIILNIQVFKNGKLVKTGDLVAPTTTTIPVVSTTLPAQ